MIQWERAHAMDINVQGIRRRVQFKWQIYKRYRIAQQKRYRKRNKLALRTFRCGHSACVRAMCTQNQKPHVRDLLYERSSDNDDGGGDIGHYATLLRCSLVRIANAIMISLMIAQQCERYVIKFTAMRCLVSQEFILLTVDRTHMKLLSRKRLQWSFFAAVAGILAPFQITIQRDIPFSCAFMFGKMEFIFVIPRWSGQYIPWRKELVAKIH